MAEASTRVSILEAAHMAKSRRPTRVSGDDKAAEVDEHAHAASGVPQRPVWELVVELGSQIPEAEWAKVPNDASINFKHYLYGAPKKRP
jgi:hypothetical protein